MPHSTEGENSLLLRAISSQNKNISFQRKSQINTGFAWTRFYLQKNCHFLTHFIRRMKDVSWDWSKMSFVCAHTHPISLAFSQSRTDTPFFFALSSPHKVYLYTEHIWIHMQAFHSTLQRALCFPPSLAFLASKGPLDSELTLYLPVWRHYIVVSSYHTSVVRLSRLIRKTKTPEQPWEDNKR